MAYTQVELNRLAWAILAVTARERDYITYKELANRINSLIGTKYTQKHIGQNALDLIEHYCVGHGLPDLTALVVEQRSQIPGKDFFVANEVPVHLSEPSLRYHWAQIRERVWDTTWSDAPPADW